MIKRSTAVAGVLAALACALAGQASATIWYWSTPTAENALLSVGWKTPPSWVHVNDAECRGFRPWKAGDARRYFQHFRFTVDGQQFNDAASRAANKAREDARAAYKAAAAAGADQATLNGLHNAYLKADSRYLTVSGGTHRRFKLVVSVVGQSRYSVTNIVKVGPDAPAPIAPIPSGAFDDPPVEVQSPRRATTAAAACRRPQVPHSPSGALQRDQSPTTALVLVEVQPR